MFWTIVGALLFVFIGIPLIFRFLFFAGNGIKEGFLTGRDATYDVLSTTQGRKEVVKWIYLVIGIGFIYFLFQIGGSPTENKKSYTYEELIQLGATPGDSQR